MDDFHELTEFGDFVLAPRTTRHNHHEDFAAYPSGTPLEYDPTEDDFCFSTNHACKEGTRSDHDMRNVSDDESESFFKRL